MNHGPFHLQINNYDSYQSTCSALDHLASQVVQVPIIRIYGSLVFYHKDAKKSYPTLIHVHNVYPYCYISCDYESIKRSNANGISTTQHLALLTAHLESSLGANFRNKPAKKSDDDDEEDVNNEVDELVEKDTQIHDNANGNPGSSKRRFIANIFLCKAVPIYGYKVGYKLYYKINFLSPLYKSRFTTLFNDGAIDMSDFGTPKFKYDILESHIPYISQFLTDYNLFSCNWILFSNCFFRYPIVNQSSQISKQSYLALKQFLVPRINQNVLGTKFERVGKSILELDIKSNQILNRKELEEKPSPIDFNHGTGFSNNTGMDVNLSSIDLTVKELAYQSKINDLDFRFNPSVMENDLWHKSRTEWNNQLELNKLLDYSIKLTTPIADEDVAKYYSNFISKSNDKLAQFPTSFKITDSEMFHLNSNLLMSDLYTYSDINELFLSQFNSEISSNGPSDQWVTQMSTHSKDTDKDSSLEKNTSLHQEILGDQRADSEEEFLEDLQQENNSHNNDDLFMDSIIDDSQILYDLTQAKPTVSSRSVVNEDISKNTILQEFEEKGIVKINYKDPYFDNADDLPPKPLVFANKRIKVSVNSDDTIPYLPISNEEVSISNQIERLISPSNLNSQSNLNPEFLIGPMINWEYATIPPTKQEVIESFKNEQIKRQNEIKFKSQLELPFSKSNDFKFSMNNSVSKRPDKFIQLTNLMMELHVNTFNPRLLPNPMTDEVSVVFYKFTDANEMYSEATNKIGILINRNSFEDDISATANSLKNFLPEVSIKVLDNEFAVVNSFLETVEIFDPDILSGYEINSMSWGYLIERYRKNWNINLLQELSRCRFKNSGKFGDRWGYTHTTNFRIVGRFTLNIWRVLRKELALNNYSFENCCYHLYHHTFPKFSNYDLTGFLSQSFNQKLFGMLYYLNKLAVEEFFINSQDLIGKNVEMSRLIGIDFNSNFYRGSQFKVESILSRLCKVENYLLNSPSKLQVHFMKPLQQIPLIMEPESNFYKSPLVVLDFQSLYPSIVIAYNYCYSTFLCRLNEFNPNKNPIGYLKHHHLSPMIIDFLYKNDALTISPNGLVFVNNKFRKSMLAKMLQEILSVRINIKNFLKSMKQSQSPELAKVLDSRQLALKLIANVTYGYTSATFSGRMPNSDIADAIVATGREILTKSIDMIEQSGFGAKVVYGDTDSLFVYLPGKTRQESFKIGEALASQVSSQFPNPVKLKFEKVYHPCVLLSKKRYVGNNYEFEGQTKPKFDAKGIETIRRDGIPAQQKILEKALKILFESNNLSSVKKYVVSEFNKIILNKVSIKDFCFAKEVRYGTYKNETYLPPGAIVARKKVEMDERSEPQYKERVPYVVYRDPTKVRLKDRCVSPEEFVESLSTDTPKSLDYEYYITKVLIPPLERIFNLMGVDIKLWYKEMPKVDKTIGPLNHNDVISNFKTIKNESCVNCGKKTIINLMGKDHQLCTSCLENPQNLILQNNLRIKSVESKMAGFDKVCAACISSKGTDPKSISNCCINDNCNNYFNKIKTLNESRFIRHKSDTISRILEN